MKKLHWFYRISTTAVLAFALCACGVLDAVAGAPPQLPAQVQTISRAALDFAFNSFDAGLYAFDLAMDLGKPPPGSPKAKAIAAAGRKVLGFLNAAETARRAGNAASYDEAFTNAKSALMQFKALLGAPATHALAEPPAPIDREAILARA
jgi:hypothetical protein